LHGQRIGYGVISLLVQITLLRTKG
jgi:hypothetical protein